MNSFEVAILRPEGSAHPLSGLVSPGLRNNHQFSPEGRHNDVVSAIQAFNPLKIMIPATYGTGRGCVVPPALNQIAHLQN